MVVMHAFSLISPHSMPGVSRAGRNAGAHAKGGRDRKSSEAKYDFRGRRGENRMPG
jgi:hypothetical protein